MSLRRTNLTVTGFYDAAFCVRRDLEPLWSSSSLHAELMAATHVGASQTGRPTLALTEGILHPLLLLSLPVLGGIRHWALIQGKERWPHFLVEEAVRLQTDRDA